MAVAAENHRARLGSPTRDTGKAVGTVADERQPIGDGGRRHAELVDHRGPIDEGPFATVVPHDSVFLVELAQVLVGRHHHDLVDLAGPATCRRRQRIVRLVVIHRPNRDPERGDPPFREEELVEELLIDPGAGLVLGVDGIAEGFDDGVEGGRDMGDAGLGNEAQHRGHDASDRPDLPAVGRQALWGTEVGTEQLVGAIDQVQLHGLDPTAVSATVDL